MTTIKALQEQLGVSTENTRTECAERTSLNKIMQQVNDGNVSDRSETAENEAERSEFDEIKDILEHILWQPISSYSTGNGFSMTHNYYDVFRNHLYEVDRTNNSFPDETNDVTVADCLVVADWYATNFKGEKSEFLGSGVIKHQEYAFCKPLWELFYNMAKKDPYFNKLWRVKISSLMNFLRYKDGYYRDIPAFEYGLNDGITLGWWLDYMVETFNGWDPGRLSIEHYEENMYTCCRKLLSFNHTICSAYFDVDARAVFLKEKSHSDPNEYIEFLAEERKHREELKGTTSQCQTPKRQ